MAGLDLPHKETGQKYFDGLLYRAHRWPQCALGGDLPAQGSMIRRSSLDAELHCAALTAVLALCRNHWIETFAARMAPLRVYFSITWPINRVLAEVTFPLPLSDASRDTGRVTGDEELGHPKRR